MRSTRPALRLSRLAAATGILFAGAAAQAQQQPDPKTTQLDTVVVTGIRASIESSIAAKRNSDSIIEAVTAEDIGKLPEASVAESLARLPGLTGQRGPDGRVDRVSIRGLSPQFTGVLLNGREIVSSNDSRAVEFDQFPAELVGSAVVYKTGDGALVAQGLSGTVDIRGIRPLDVRGRQFIVNVRGERNSLNNLVDGVASATGSRMSFSYVDQFANNTIGVAVGYARLDAPTQSKTTELVEYGDYTPFGLPLTGNTVTPTGQALLPMYWTATGSTKKNVRDGLMAVLEYKPSAELHSQLDLYYSKFKTHEVGGKFAQSLFGNWSAGITPAMSNVSTTTIGKDVFATGATISQLVANVGNFDTRRSDDIVAIGWNTEMKLADKWKAMADVSYSRDKRLEEYSEAYAGPYNYTTKQWNYGAYKWNVPMDNSPQTFTPVVGDLLSNPANMAFGDVQGMDWVPNDAWIGAIRKPEVNDKIKSLKLSLKRELEGFFSAATFGVNYTERSKDVIRHEQRILMKQDTQGNYIRSIPTAAVQTPFDMSWAGQSSVLRVDVPALVASGNYTLEEGQFSKWAANASSVSEKVTTGFVKLDIESSVFGIPLRGNLGAQVVHASQAAEGWDFYGDDEHPNPALLFKRSGGTSYTNVLPSLNLVADMSNNWVTRFGWATTIVRPNIVDMRAGSSTPAVNGNLAGTPHAGEWSTSYAGNPNLKPWRAVGIDLSVEKYFGKRSYVSVAAFRKNLLSYIYPQLTTVSTANFPQTAPPGVTPLPIAPQVQPMNGAGGKVEGVEFATSLEGGLLTSALDGFGLQFSASKLHSNIKETGSDPLNTVRNVPLDGFSGLSNSLTAYYEKYGFSARISQRYRAPFTATTRDIYFNSTTLQYLGDKVIDVQLGYAFEEGSMKGLSLVLAVGNLKDRPTINMKSMANAPDLTVQTPNLIRYNGRTTLLGMNYKF